MKKNKPGGIKSFQKKIWDFYKKNKRDFPWRKTFDPYKILISEVMLQQTQTYRVQPKYEAWIKEFPDFETLAKAPFSKVLTLWSGLGYNRRAIYLHKIAKIICSDVSIRGNILNSDFLQTLPGIGKNTAAAIIVFSQNKYLPFVETNIRRTIIHHFFQNKKQVDDKQILSILSSIDSKKPREWYYALMDYGSFLAKKTVNPNRKSKHYAKQSKFEGSLRQVRGQILKILLKKKSVKIHELETQISANHFATALRQLKKEKFIVLEKGKILLRK